MSEWKEPTLQELKKFESLGPKLLDFDFDNKPLTPFQYHTEEVQVPKISEEFIDAAQRHASYLEAQAMMAKVSEAMRANTEAWLLKSIIGMMPEGGWPKPKKKTWQQRLMQHLYNLRSKWKLHISWGGRHECDYY